MAGETLQTDLVVKAEINLYYDLYIPESAGPRSPLMVAVHGYGAHKRYMMKEAQRVAPPGFVIASLQGPHQHFRRTNDGYRVGFGWLTEFHPDEYVALHHKFVLDVIDRVDADGTIDPSHVFMFGFSQSCALNFRFALTYPDVLKAIVGVCGGLPSDLDENPKYEPFNAETFYLYGTDDEFYSLDKFRGFDQRLKALLPNYRSKKYEAKHEITHEMRQDIREFLKQGD
jgi:phospholipase/carboxylesterase